MFTEDPRRCPVYTAFNLECGYPRMPQISSFGKAFLHTTALGNAIYFDSHFLRDLSEIIIHLKSFFCIYTILPPCGKNVFLPSFFLSFTNVFLYVDVISMKM